MRLGENENLSEGESDHPGKSRMFSEQAMGDEVNGSLSVVNVPGPVVVSM